MRYLFIGFLLLIGCSQEKRTIEADMYVVMEEDTILYKGSLTVPEELWIKDSTAVKDSLENLMINKFLELQNDSSGQ